MAHATRRGPGRRPQSRPTKSASHNDARAAGIPKVFRQYAKRFGGLDIFGIVQIHRQHREGAMTL